MSGGGRNRHRSLRSDPGTHSTRNVKSLERSKFVHGKIPLGTAPSDIFDNLLLKALPTYALSRWQFPFDSYELKGCAMISTFTSIGVLYIFSDFSTRITNSWVPTLPSADAGRRGYPGRYNQQFVAETLRLRAQLALKILRP